MVKQLTILFSVISLIYGQQKHITQSNPCEDAAIDAKNDVEKWLWIEAGFRAFRRSKKLSKNDRICIMYKESKDIDSFITDVVMHICNKYNYKKPRFISNFINFISCYNNNRF